MSTKNKVIDRKTAADSLLGGSQHYEKYSHHSRHGGCHFTDRLSQAGSIRKDIGTYEGGCRHQPSGLLCHY
jgi:hypothetical protein